MVLLQVSRLVTRRYLQQDQTGKYKPSMQHISTVSKRALLLLALNCLCGLSKASIFNAPCDTNAQCQLMYNNEYRCYDHHCMRKDFTYSSKDFIGFILVIIISMITNAGGVGAGTIIIPAYIFFFDFVSSDAIPLSRVTIFAGSLVNYLINWTQRDPKDPNKFLINYNLASVMMPLLLAGTQIGVILSRFFPAAAITLVLFCYLISSSRQMLARARKDTAKEKEQEKALQRDESDLNKTHLTEDDEDTENHSKADMVDSDRKPRNQSNILQVSSSNSNGATELTSEVSTRTDHQLGEKQIRTSLQSSKSLSVPHQLTTLGLAKSQWENFVSILFSMFVIIVSSVLKGGEGRPSILGFGKCSLGGWAVFLVTQAFCIGLAICTYKWNKFSFDEEDKNVLDADEAIMRPLLRRKLLWASYTTGVLAGFLGIGGGMVLGLYMLNLGMDIQVSTALSTFVVLFSSASTTFQFVIAGAIQMRHAWLFMILSLIGAVIGNFVLKALLRKYKRPSVLIWVLFGVLCIATGVLPIEMGFNVLSKSKSAIAFGHFC